MKAFVSLIACMTLFNAHAQPLVLDELHFELRNSMEADDRAWADSVLGACQAIQANNLAMVASMQGHKGKALLVLSELARSGKEKELTVLNLGGVLVMSGMAKAAIPILEAERERLTGKSQFHNNLGQAYAHAGFTSLAKLELNKCLELDPLHPEANHTLAIFHLKSGNKADARHCLEQELLVAQRMSTIELMQRSNMNIKLLPLRKARQQLQGKAPQSWYDKVGLSKFSLPDLPMTLESEPELVPLLYAYRESVLDEYQYWYGRGTAPLSEKEQTGAVHGTSSLRGDVVEYLLEELYEEFNAEYLSEVFDAQTLAKMQTYGQKLWEELEEIDQTNQAPAGAGQEKNEAYQRIRCEKKVGAINKYLATVNGAISNRSLVVSARWKGYVNGVIHLCSLYPSAGNKRLAMLVVASYFSTMSAVAGPVAIELPPVECEVNVSLEEALARLQSERELELTCPDFFKVKKEFYGVQGQLDCDGFSLEADIGFKAGLKKEFKTGLSTMWIGLGFDHSFKIDKLNLEVGKLGLTEEVYIVFDRDNQFADAGIRGEGKLETPGGSSVDLTYTFAVNAGYQGDLKATGGFQTVLKSMDLL